jgi:DnaJ-class molecular chaperone
MAKEACRTCDGRGSRKIEDRENVFNVTTKVCSRCNGVGIEPEPSKSKRRSFGKKKKKKEEEEDDGNLNRAADRFLRRHGCGRGGR